MLTTKNPLLQTPLPVLKRPLPDIYFLKTHGTINGLFWDRDVIAFKHGPREAIPDEVVQAMEQLHHHAWMNHATIEPQQHVEMVCALMLRYHELGLDSYVDYEPVETVPATVK